MVYALLLAAAAVIDVGSQKQLFIDHKFIESAEGIQLTVAAPRQSHERLLTTDAAWESDAKLGSYHTVVKEADGRIRLWYNVMAGKAAPGQNPPFLGVAYAESRDGIHFTKPVLNLVERNGTRANNLVLPPDPTQLVVGGGTIWRDDNPNAAADARYKSWSKMYPKPGSAVRGPHRLWKSPDGLRWTMDERAFTGLRAADTQPSWFWEPRIGRYVGYSREWVRDRAAGFGVRMASYNESDDLVNWNSTYFALEPDERDLTAAPALQIDGANMQVHREDVLPRRERRTGAATVKEGEDQVLTPSSPLDFYGPGVFPYEGVYVALIPTFHHWRTDGPNTGDIQLAVSRDGRHFTRPDAARRPFLSTGADGTWDSKWIYPTLRPVRVGDELWLYYYGTNHDHGSRVDRLAAKEEGAISRAVMHVDRFVAAEAAYEGGTLMTPPVRFAGSRLELNLDTGAGGLARVEILEESGKPIAGFSLLEADDLNGNRAAFTATWNGGKSDVSSLAGRAVRLRVRMRAARLYAFQFR